jgi:hypothetical protein
VGFVVGKVARGQVFSEHFGFPCQFSFKEPRYAHLSSAGTGEIGPIVVGVPGGPILQIKRKLHQFVTDAF